MKQRRAKVIRKTKETSIEAAIGLDRARPVSVDTSIPFMDHMLELMAHQGGVSLVVKASGDTEIDDHHLVEDLGITLGQALSKALGRKKGIGRYGKMLLPMDEALSYVALDLSGRPFLDYKVNIKSPYKGFDYDLLHEFFYAFAVNAGMTLHISLLRGSNNHHISESLFKGIGRALGEAVQVNPGRKGVPSTKGRL